MPSVFHLSCELSLEEHGCQPTLNMEHHGSWFYVILILSA